MFRFPIQKLLDWRERWVELETSLNPFSLVVMAHLKAQESKDGLSRKRWKWHLIRLLYQRGYSREQVLELFRILDWMLRLPGDLERLFMSELVAFEEEAKMPYITSVERLSREEGRKEGRQEGEAMVLSRQITLKFGLPSEITRQRIKAVDSETLLIWSERMLTAESLDDVFE